MNERTIFLSAMERHAAEERSAYLDEACGNDSGLRQRVEQLLAAHEQDCEILDNPAAVATVGQAAEHSENPGDSIGPYKLREQIGEGGFGVVFLADQTEPVRRQVALKIIKPGMDTREVIARFEAERQALALMDHPDIAKVLDAGATESGRPYFVMELVKGVPITEYCDQCRLTTRERLELFIGVCRAVQHAHQKGIIHRDIKPSNVLVAMRDGQPAPRIIDFGVAKALNQRLTERTLQTGFAQMLGTPMYMSPEQAELSPLEVDTRSDIYSLGVLLYELLTGTTPFERERLSQASFDDLRRIIRNEEPPRPSARVSTQGFSGETVARNRRTDSRRLQQQIRGDLDWIVMEALEKDRGRRYESASAFSADVQRYLDDEPIEARPPSATYRFRKFATRNKGMLATAMSVLTLLVLGATGLAISNVLIARERDATVVALRERDDALAAKDQALVEARDNEARADTEAEKAKAVSSLMLEMLDSANPLALKGPDYTVRQLLDDFSDSIDGRLDDQPEVEAQLRMAIGAAYKMLDMPEKAEPHFLVALELCRDVFGPRHPKVAECLLAFAGNARYLRKYSGAESSILEALEICREQNLQWRIIRALVDLQEVNVQQRKLTQADAAGHEALALARTLSLDRSAVAIPLFCNLAASKNYQGEYAEAERLAQQALNLARHLHGDDRPQTAWARLELGDALYRQGEFTRAEAAYRAALSVFEKFYGRDHLTTNGVLCDLGMVALAQGDHATAEAVFQEILTTATTRVDNYPANPRFESALDDARFHLATLYADAQRPEEAVALFSSVIESQPDNAEAWFRRGEVRRRLLRQWSQALTDYDQAVRLDATHALARDKLAWILVSCPERELWNPARAVELAREALELTPDEGYYLNTLGVACYRAGLYDDAVDALNQSASLRMDDNGYDYFFLAMAHWELDQRDEAEQWYRKGVAWHERHPSDFRLDRFRAEAEEVMGRDPEEDGTSASPHLESGTPESPI